MKIDSHLSPPPPMGEGEGGGEHLGLSPSPQSSPSGGEEVFSEYPSFKFQQAEESQFGFCSLRFGAYLGFVIWNLRFKRQDYEKGLPSSIHRIADIAP
jgi:hypothetical protein